MKLLMLFHSDEVMPYLICVYEELKIVDTDIGKDIYCIIKEGEEIVFSGCDYFITAETENVTEEAQVVESLKSFIPIK